MSTIQRTSSGSFGGGLERTPSGSNLNPSSSSSSGGNLNNNNNNNSGSSSVGGGSATNTTGGLYEAADGKKYEIREVWAANLDEEMDKIRELIEQYPMVAMDTEFPGVVVKVNPDMHTGISDMLYETIKSNVDLLKIIQLGLTLSDKHGNLPEENGHCLCWQFNFKYSLNGEVYLHDSIQMLCKHGIDFDRLEKHGIEIHRFGEQLVMSGLVLNEEVKWISFSSNYDFGYLLKTLTNASLPPDESSFFQLLNTFFPCFLDIKYMVNQIEALKYCGLSNMGEILKIDRVGIMHQAGSDSLLTLQCFFAIVKKFMNGTIEKRFYQELYGIGDNSTRNYAKQYLFSSGGGGGSTLAYGGGDMTGSLQYAQNVHFPIGSHSNVSHGY